MGSGGLKLVRNQARLLWDFSVVFFFRPARRAEHEASPHTRGCCSYATPKALRCSIPPYPCSGLCLLLYAAGLSLIPQKEKTAIIIL